MEIVKDFTGKCWKGGNTDEFIILHATGSSEATTLNDILRFLRLSNFVSCHYVIGKRGEIVQMVREEDRAWHAGSSWWKGKSNLNNYSIGIEILSDNKTFNDWQRDSVIWLCRNIMKRNKIPPHKVLRHKDIAPKRKVDVSDAFLNGRWRNWSDFQMALVRKS